MCLGIEKQGDVVAFTAHPARTVPDWPFTVPEIVSDVLPPYTVAFTVPRYVLVPMVMAPRARRLH